MHPLTPCPGKREHGWGRGWGTAWGSRQGLSSALAPSSSVISFFSSQIQILDPKSKLTYSPSAPNMNWNHWIIRFMEDEGQGSPNCHLKGVLGFNAAKLNGGSFTGSENRLWFYRHTHTLPFLPLRAGRVPPQHRPGPWKLISWMQGPPTVYDDDYCRALEFLPRFQKSPMWRSVCNGLLNPVWPCGQSEEHHAGSTVPALLITRGAETEAGAVLSLLSIWEPFNPCCKSKRQALLILPIFINVQLRQKVVKYNTNKAHDRL